MGVYHSQFQWIFTLTNLQPQVTLLLKAINYIHCYVDILLNLFFCWYRVRNFCIEWDQVTDKRVVCDKHWTASCSDVCETDLSSGTVVRSRFGRAKRKISFWNSNILINKSNTLFKIKFFKYEFNEFIILANYRDNDNFISLANVFTYLSISIRSNKI